MAKKPKTIFGYCPTHAFAEEAVDRLRLSGFRNTDVSALAPEGADFGCVLDWTAGPRIPKSEARACEDWINQGGIVLFVRCDNADWVRRAQNVLERAATAGAAC